MPFDFGRFEIVEEAWPAAELARARALASGSETRLADAKEGTGDG
jgi:hypothetical protein